MTCWLQRNWKR